MRTFYFKRDSSYDKEYGNKEWLYINNCGYYYNVTKDVNTARHVPRADYHILYVSNGEIYINGETIKNGEAYLLLPGEPHVYTYKNVEESRYYWIHFTGNKVSEILSRYDISKGVNRAGGRKQEKDSVFGMLTEELIRCSDEASDYAVSLFLSFLSLFKGESEQKRGYEEARKTLESSAENLTVEQVAASYGITASHFIRSFKSEYGMTPNEYRLNYRISKAVSLLRMTDLSVQDIAYQCGFDDPFYFSRIFKKRVGITPSKYRGQI